MRRLSLFLILHLLERGPHEWLGRLIPGAELHERRVSHVGPDPVMPLADLLNVEALA